MSGGVSFEVERLSCRFLDPTRDFEPVEKITEIRTDPLTHRRSRVLDMPFQPQKPDLETLVSRARASFNPFAAERRTEVTPRFIGEVEGVDGRLARGEALVVPNLFPYDRHSAVTVLSEADFVPLTGFTEGLLADAFAADLEYLRRVRDKHREHPLRHFSVNWNYMPLAGGSLVHPHHQLIASPVLTNHLADVEAGLRRYAGPYFRDLVATEEGGERWVGREGGSSWLTGYAPMGHIDLLGIFKGRRSLFDLTDGDVGDLSRALLRTFEYLDEAGFASFNFALYGLEGVEHFEVHCRLSPRFLLNNELVSSDVNYFEVSHGESLAFFYPEQAAQGLRAKFTQATERGAG